MCNGGYLILDFKNFALTSGQEASITGLYESSQNVYKKPTLVHGLIVGNVEYPDFFAPFIENNNSVKTEVVIGNNTITINIDSDDNVTVTVE